MVKKIIIQSLEPIAKYKLKLEVSRRYGGDGLKVFILVDKSNTIEYEEIIKTTKISRDKINEIIDYMESIGLIYTEGAIDKVEKLEKEEEMEGGDYSYKLVSNDSLLRFKHQKIIFKEFSSQGIKIYDVIRKGETNLSVIQRETKLSEDKILEILDFMKNNDIIVQKESEESKKAKEQEIEKKEKERVSAIEDKIRKEEEEKIEKERKRLEEERKKLEDKIKKEEEERKKLEEKLRKEEEEKQKLREKLEKEKKEAKKEVIEKEIEKKEVEIKKIQEKTVEHKEKEEEFIFKVDDIDEEEFNLFAKDMGEEKPEIKEEKKVKEEEFDFKSQPEEEEEFNFEEEPEQEFKIEEQEKPKSKKEKIIEPEEEEEEEFKFEEEEKEVVEEKVEKEEEKEVEEREKKSDEEEFKLEDEEEEESEVVEEEIVEEEEKEEPQKPKINAQLHYIASEMQLSEKYKKQKEIFDKFGAEGMKLYSMFTFETTIKNAIEMTKIEEQRALEIVEYLIDEELIEVSEKNKDETQEEEEIEEEQEEGEEDENYNFTNIKIYDEEEIEGDEEAEEEEEKPVETKTQVYEQKLRDEFGEKGVKIYRLIDGRKNAEQIMKEVGVDEDTIIKVFEFMEKEGMIKLEHPTSSSTNENEKEKIVESRKKMEPISDISTSATKKIIIDDRIPIDVPIVKKLSLPDKMTLEAKLLARFGAKALRVNTKINDETDVVSLAIEMAISLDDLDEILYSISNAGGCTFATLSNEDIKRKYGDEAFELYELFGRDGIMLYELIGKMNIIDIIKFSKIDPRKASKIIYKTNLLLGIDDIDEETIFKSIKDVK